MKVRNEFILEAHKAACSEWKAKIEKEFPKLFPKTVFEVGEWYEHIFGAICQYRQDTEKGIMSGYGFAVHVDDSYVDRMIMENPESWKPLTDFDKLEKLFIKEAENKGLKIGNFFSLRSGTFDAANQDPTYFDQHDNALYIGGRWAWKDGVWAKPFETITKAEAEKHLNKKIID